MKIAPIRAALGFVTKLINHIVTKRVDYFVTI